MNSARHKHAARLAQRKIAGTHFVVDPAHTCLHQPQGAGEDIWTWLGDGKTVGQIVERLTQEYDVTADRAERDVQRFLRELRRKKLIERAET